MKKILIIGNNFKFAARGPLLVKYFVERDYKINFINPLFFSSPPLKTILIRKIIAGFNKIWMYMTIILNSYNSDLIFVWPWNTYMLKTLNRINLFKKKILSDYYLSFYHTYVIDRKLVEPGSRKAEEYKKVDKYMLTKTHKLSYLTDYELMTLCKDLGIKISELAPRTRVPLVVEHKKIKRNFKAHDPFCICWWGTYIPLHGLGKIIEMAKILNENKTNFKLYILGNDDKNSMPYIKLINEEKLNHCIEIRNDLTFSNGTLEQFLINECDLALGIFGDSVKAKAVITNKQIEAHAMQIPIMTMSTAALDEFYKPNEDLFVCENTPDSMAETAFRVIGDETLRRKVAENGYKIYIKYFSPEAFYKNMDRAILE